MKEFRVAPDEPPRLHQRDPGDTGGIAREDAEARTRERLERLGDLQERLYADGRRALLVVLQAMDAGGKDSTIKRIFSGVNPQGCRVTSFKVPSPIERAHDFLWRVHKEVPPKGFIGVFNRSHYEDVLIVRVHEHVDDDRVRRR